MIGRRFRSDVFVEGREVVTPLFTDDDAASAVIGIFGIVGVMTALLHRTPVAVFSAMALPVRRYQLGHLLNAMAAAGFDVATTQVISGDDFPGAAGTDAMPVSLGVVDGVGDRRRCDGGESVKALPGEIVRAGVKGDGIELNFGELNEGIGV